MGPVPQDGLYGKAEGDTGGCDCISKEKGEDAINQKEEIVMHMPDPNAVFPTNMGHPAKARCIFLNWQYRLFLRIYS